MSDQLVTFADLRDLFAATPAPAAGDDSAPLPFNLVEKYVKRSPKPEPKPKPAPPPPPAAIRIGIASFPPDDLQVLVALATDAGIVPPETPTPEAVELIEDACKPLKRNGEVYMEPSRVRLLFQYLIFRSNGMRSQEAILASGLPNWTPVGLFKAHNKYFRAMYHAADERFMGAINPHVVDSLVEAAVEGDTVRKFKDGEVVSEAHRANVRAQELVLKATDARFRDSDKAAGPSGGVTYNIGAINVAALPPAGGAAPALPAAEPAPETIEIGPDSCGFSADRPSVPRGNHA